MRVTRSDRETALMEFTYDELLILNNALNEVCNGLDFSELATRMGAQRQQVESLLAQVHSLLERMEKS